MDWDYGSLEPNRMALELPVDWWQAGHGPAGLPARLCADGTKGVTELTLAFDLEPGFYAFHFAHGLVAEPANFSGQFWILYVDEREIGCGGIAPVRLTPEEQARRDTQTVRFRCADAGRHRLTLRITNVDAHQDCAVDLLGVGLRRLQAPPRRHSLLGDRPGRCFVDVWGWMNCLSYQRAIRTPPPPGDAYVEEERVAEWDNYFTADLAYMLRNVIAESYRWGANGQEVYVSDNYHGTTHWPMSWSLDDPLSGAQTYNHFAFHHMQDEELRELARLAHRHDSLIHWYGHVPERDAYSWHRNFSGPERTRLAWLLNLQSKMARDFADVLSDREAAIDGSAGEYMELMPITESADEIAELTRRLWRYNPGAYLSDNVVNTWDRQRCGASPAFSQTLLGGWTRDDFSPNDLYGDAFRHGELGKVHFNLQGDCRSRPTNFFGGWIGPDLAVKECNDFFRQRALEPEDPHNVAVWWINESRAATPGASRRYVYAVSQDPLKVAAGYFLSTLGRGGKMEQVGQRRPYKHTGVASAFYRRRCELPPDTAALHNNHLALHLLPDSQGGELRVDLEGLAHYDGHGLDARLSSQLLTTEVAGGIDRVWTVTDFPEPAGYKAVLRQRVCLLCRSGGEIREERVYTAHNDTPYLRLHLTRRGAEGPCTRLGAQGYDILRVGGQEHRQGAELPVPSSLVFADAAGVAPPWAVVILDPGRAKRLRWVPGEGAILEGEAADGELELAFVALTSLYQESDLTQLSTAIQQDEVECVALVEGTHVANELDLPRVVVARLNDPAGTPYLVQEQGWWMFRGAQPAVDDDCDYLKVYLAAGSRARIVRYGFIDGIVKPGWGCQYTLAIADVERAQRTSSCKVDVLSVTPNVFAPRVEFAAPIASAKVDGRTWRYFDGQVLFLPNRVQVYRVEVTRGHTRTPTLLRTFARVESCHWRRGALVFRAELPPWCDRLHPKLRFTAAIACAGRRLTGVTGGTVLESGERGAVVELDPGEVRAEFA